LQYKENLLNKKELEQDKQFLTIKRKSKDLKNKEKELSDMECKIN
jgi:hypothetical protein